MEGLLVFEPRVFKDERGYFFESWNERTMADHGIHHHFVQDNEAKSCKGVLRGLHYQLEPHAQTKLVRVISGEVLDVVVDLRPSSPTFGQSLSVILSSTNFKQMLIPKGFAHGYIVLSEEAVFAYKCDNYYHKEAEGGIKFDSGLLGIDWILPPSSFLLSDKDRVLPEFDPDNFRS